MPIQSERRRVKAPHEACIEEPFRAPNQNLLMKVGLGGFPPIKGIGIDRSVMEPDLGMQIRSVPKRGEL